MKNTLRAKLIASASVLGLGISLSLSGFALAADLNWSADQNVTLGANTITILSGSGATSLVVNPTNMVVVIPVSGIFNVRSSTASIDYSGLISGSVVGTCVAGVHQLNFTASAGSTETITLTPGSGVCVTPTPPPPPPSSSGGSGGQGTTPPPTPPPSTPGAATHPSGTLVISNGTVFLIENGTRVGFRDAAEYLSHGYNFNQVVQASVGDLALPLSTSVKKALEGTLAFDFSDNVTVYMIGSNGTKRGFVSAAVFTNLGYKFENLARIDLTDYPTGEVITDASLAHPDGALVLNGQTVWWIRGNLRLGFESEAVFNTYGFPWSRIVLANGADMALPVGPLVKFRDGTLVYDGGNYYLISSGNKLMFTSVEDLIARGYQTSNVINASLSGYTSGGNVQ